MATTSDHFEGIEVSEGPPETVTCATCGGTAERITAPSAKIAGYRCTNCHAGGHIVGKHHAGGVFERLPNLATRRLAP
jgi:hypothetical protein